MENSLRKHVKKFKSDPTVRSLDTDLLSRYSSLVAGKTPIERRRRVVRNPQNSMENNLRKHVKKFKSDPTVRSLDTDLLSWYSSPVDGMHPTVHHGLVVLIRRISMENILLKHVKKFERDPTV